MTVRLIRTSAGLRFVARLGNVYAVSTRRDDAIREACRAFRRAAA